MPGSLAMMLRKNQVTKSHDPARALVSIEQVRAQLDCSRSTVDKLCREGKLEKVRFGGHTRITRRSLDALLDHILNGAAHP